MPLFGSRVVWKATLVPTPLLTRSMIPTTPRFLSRAGAIFVTVGMIAGAFGAHGLKKKPDMTAESVQAWLTACHYAIYNGLGLLVISMHPHFAGHRFAGPAIICGGLVFSGTIAAMALGQGQLRVLGPVTPLGGAVMIAGYLSLAW